MLEESAFQVLIAKRWNSYGFLQQSEFYKAIQTEIRRIELFLSALEAQPDAKDIPSFLEHYWASKKFVGSVERTQELIRETRIEYMQARAHIDLHAVFGLVPAEVFKSLTKSKAALYENAFAR